MATEIGKYIEFEVRGHKSLKSRMDFYEKEFIKDLTGIKNREIISKMRTKLQLLFPGADVKGVKEGQNIRIVVKNVKQLNEVANSKLFLEISSFMNSLQSEEFTKERK